MRRSDQAAPIERRSSIRLFPAAATLPLPVYRDFIDMLFGMRLPIVGLGAVFVGVCVLAAYELGNSFFAVLAALGALTTLSRLVTLRAYSRASPVGDMDALRRWERRYAIGNYTSAVLLALLNLAALMIHHPLLHLITISLVFSFGAGVVSRISVRPKICVASLLLATVPTVVALVHLASRAMRCTPNSSRSKPCSSR